MRKLFVVIGLLLPLFLSAQPVKTQNVVFDCASDDLAYVSSRLWLIEESAKEYKEKKIPYKIVLTIHSGCTEVVSKESAEGDKLMQNIQKKLQNLSTKHQVSVEACQIATDRYGIEKDDLVSEVKLVRNSITRVIELQNEGYAYVPYHK
ncbi:MAG: DsrE family protein [Epsilonproteobacteria bacterium]|nr:DsrE family protein [Campylobacterota bacterium]